MAVSSIEEYQRKVRERVEAEKAEKESKKKDSGSDEPPFDFIEQCLDCNEIGDSMLYNRLHKGKFINNVIEKNGWMSFNGHHWQRDYSQKAKATVENVALQYLRLHDHYSEEITEHANDEDKGYVRALQAKKKAIVSRVKKLRSDKGRIAVMNCVISNNDPLIITTKDLDNHPWLLPVKNGVVDLRTGEFRDGNPEDYITKASPTPWRGMESKCAVFEKFLYEIFSGDEDMIEYLQRVIGYAITGLRTERLFVVLYGKYGQNGKGTIMDIVSHILGEDLSGPIQTEMLMSQRIAKSPSGPTPDIMAMKGRRVIWASETEKYHSFAAGKVKLYSGGDPLVGRGIQDRLQTTYYPTHVLFLICNKLPKAPPEDKAFWTRLKPFEFFLSFVNNPKEEYERQVNGNLFEELMAEAPGILAWMVRGTKKWQDKGLTPPQKILDFLNKYREHEDDIQDFLDECCVVDFNDHSKENATAANDLYSRFKKWWTDRNSYKPMGQKEFSDLLEMKGFKKFKSSKNFYQYVRLFFDFDDAKTGNYGGGYG